MDPEKICQLMKIYHFPIREVAAKSGYSTVSIRKFLSGERRGPRVTKCLAFAINELMSELQKDLRGIEGAATDVE